MTWLALPISLAKKIPWQLWVLAGVLFSFWLYGAWQYRQGAADTQAAWDESVERGKVIVADLKKRQGTVTERVVYQTVERIKTIKEKGDAIVKQVEVLVPDGSCDLPGGFRLLHDAAAANTIPDTSKSADAEPVPAQTVATTVAENYTTCNAAIADLQGLRQWAVEQHQLYLDQCKERGVLCSTDSIVLP